MRMAQKQMGELFEVEPNTITTHLRGILAVEKLEEWATTRKIRVVQIPRVIPASEAAQFFPENTIDLESRKA